MKNILLGCTLVLALGLMTELIHAEDKPKKEPQEEKVQTQHVARIGGQEISYQATAGTFLLREEDGKPRASVFYVAYTRTNLTNAASRPITFSFNGGPGSSSVWLHMGTLGPRRVAMPPDGTLPPPPFTFVNNEQSILDETDLVFIDPVSTGFSRAVPGEDPRKFHGIEEDVRSVGEFIRLYTTRHKRWSSPKFLIGESYGTTRAAALSGFLQDRYGMYLNGVMLVSVVLDFQTLSFVPGNDLSYILFLPSYTAVAWYHKKLPPDLQEDFKKARAESEAFALGDYTLALMQGAGLGSAERSRVAEKLARLTGLSREYVERANLRVRMPHFTKELLRGNRLTVGRFDGRLTGMDRDGVGTGPEYDPSYTAVLGPFTSVINDYLRSELQFESELPYEMLTGKVMPWDYGDYKNRYVNVAETLREAMTRNPSLKVLVGSGYYDLATPYLATRHTMNHLELAPNLQTNLTLVDYPAGHMMYTHEPSRAQLKEDLGRFLRQARGGAAVTAPTSTPAPGAETTAAPSR